MDYDSTQDTKNHIHMVQNLMGQIVLKLAERVQLHDASKLQSPEKEMFDKYTPMLRELTYGSDEYKKTLAEMGKALQHHYENNSHHPEYYGGEVGEMDLVDVIEMLCDWIAATRRHADGSVRDSLAINKKRFGISKQLYKILNNTAVNMDWIPSVASDYDE